MTVYERYCSLLIDYPTFICVDLLFPVVVDLDIRSLLYAVDYDFVTNLRYDTIPGDL